MDDLAGPMRRLQRAFWPKIHLFLPRSPFAAAQDNVEFETQSLLGQRGFPIKQRNQTVARRFIRGAI